jgi:hypothetical protein
MITKLDELSPDEKMKYYQTGMHAEKERKNQHLKIYLTQWSIHDHPHSSVFFVHLAKPQKETKKQ